MQAGCLRSQGFDASYAGKMPALPGFDALLAG